jgi:flagellar basal-body rod protein FlgC
MSLFSIFAVAGSALTAQSMRLNVVASNLANADSATSSTGEPYRARQVLFSAEPVSGDAVGVRVKRVLEDDLPPRVTYDPKHPLADDKGYVTYPNVNVAEEMVNMISASRSYQNNVEVMNTAKQLLAKTLTLGQ